MSLALWITCAAFFWLTSLTLGVYMDSGRSWRGPNHVAARLFRQRVRSEKYLGYYLGLLAWAVVCSIGAISAWLT